MKIVACVAAFAVFAGSAEAETLLTFSGGDGTPLSITLNNPIAFVINQTPNGGSPYFVFEDVGNDFSTNLPITGTISYAINAGTAQAITTVNSGLSAGDITANDLYLFGATPGTAVGDAVTLNPGTDTTTSNYAGAPPAGGPFTAFVADASGNAISLTVPLPEPSTWAMVVGGLATLAFIHVRTRVVKLPPGS